MTKKVKTIDVPSNGTNAKALVKDHIAAKVHNNAINAAERKAEKAKAKAITPAKKAPAKGPKVITVTPAELAESVARIQAKQARANVQPAKGPKVITVTPAELVEHAAPVMSALQAQSASMSEGFTHVANMLNDADDAINGLGSRVDRHDVAIEKAIAELASHAEGLDVLTRVVLSMRDKLLELTGMVDTEYSDDYEYPNDEDDNAISPATIERSANIILAETVSHVRENMAKGTAGYNKKIIPQIGVVKDSEGNVLSHTDYRVYLTTPQHRTFKVAFGVGKKLGNRMTLSQAAQMLYDAV